MDNHSAKRLKIHDVNTKSEVITSNWGFSAVLVDSYFDFKKLLILSGHF